MRICNTIDDMRAACRAARRGGKRLGFVPTMGALHEGHLSLVRAARASCDAVAVSIFVNPTQFGPTEDLAKYPRSFERDRELLEKEGVELLFAPSVEEMYPAGAVTWVTVEGLSDKLDGRSRPGHFRGVTTVVAKLFHIVEPDAAFFGQKDASAGGDRSPHGARPEPSRGNRRLPDCARARRPGHEFTQCLSRSATAKTGAGVASFSAAREEIVGSRRTRRGETDGCSSKEEFAGEKSVRLDYFEIVDPDSLDPLENAAPGALVAVAAFVGTTRLIDNILLP